MVTLEGSKNPEILPDLQSKLEHHWMFDSVTAHELAIAMPEEGTEHIDALLSRIEQQGPEAIQKRDDNRLEVQKIFNGESDKKLIILGPCSLDADTDYTELFDYIEELQFDNPDAMFGLRLNGAKPRSSGGNTGLFTTTKPGGRRKQYDAYEDAFQRGIAIFTEVTDKDQFSVLAPYLTGAWIGARDMASTDLRTLFSATRLNVMVKNAVDGGLTSLRDAVSAIRKGTEENDGSGVNLGHIASTCRHEDGGPATFTVGEGNPNVAIIARGYELRDEVYDGNEIKMVKNVSEKEAEALAVKHLSEVCMIAAQVDCAAALDGSHKVPEMLSIDKKHRAYGDRFLSVLRKFKVAGKEGRIRNVERLSILLGEISVNVGITDKNLVLTALNKKLVADEIREFKNLGKPNSRGTSLEVSPRAQNASGFTSAPRI